MGKPDNWSELSTEEKTRIGTELFQSPKGHCVVSKALYYAVMKLLEVTPAMRENSSIEDMEILYETVFPDFRKSIFR